MAPTSQPDGTRKVTSKSAKSAKNSVVEWNCRAFPGTPIFGYHWPTRKKSRAPPVRAIGYGSRASNAIASVTVSPGASGAGSVTSASERSSGFPSSGWMGRQASGVSRPSGPRATIDFGSIQPHGSGSSAISFSIASKRPICSSDSQVVRWCAKALR